MRLRMILVFTLLVLFGNLSTTAQERKEEPPAIAVTVENGETVWKLTAGATVTLPELIRQYADYRNLCFLYHRLKVAGDFTVDVGDQRSLKGTEIDVFVAAAFEQFRLCIVERGGNVRTIVPAVEAMTYAPFVLPADVENENPARWINVVYKFQHTNPQEAFAAMRPKPEVERYSGPRLFQMRTVTLSGPALQVKEDLQLVRELDLAGKTVIRGFDVPKGIDMPEAVLAVKNLLNDQSPSPTVEALPGVRRLLVRAGEKDMDAVAQAVAAMK